MHDQHTTRSAPAAQLSDDGFRPRFPVERRPFRRNRDVAFYSDEELRHWTRYYRRRVALVEQEAGEYSPLDLDSLSPLMRDFLLARNPTQTVDVDGARAFWRVWLDECEHEEASREEARRLGVPRDLDRFPDDTIRRVKAVPLDDAFARFGNLDLRRPNAAGERRGPCPFCETSAESTALVVHTAETDNQWYWCHACNEHGTVIDLAQASFGLNFPQAVEFIATNYGIPLPAAAPAVAPRKPETNVVRLSRKRGA